MELPFRKKKDLCQDHLGETKSTTKQQKKKKQLTAPQGLLKFLNFYAFLAAEIVCLWK